MFKKRLPRIVAGSVIAMVAIAAVLTFTRGETPPTDTASATLPDVSGTSGPVVVGSTTKPKPSATRSADAAERNAAKEDADSTGTTKTPVRTPSNGSPTSSPTTTPPPDPEPEPEPTTTPPAKKCYFLLIEVPCPK
ncbi:MAG: hypothetical protein ABIN55_12830 [Aeromicrobium sp.]